MTSASKRARLHEFLLASDTYPDRPQRVEMKETHSSRIYLTDRYVYKQKKQVKFEFLDFSTLAKRWQSCKQEVALNQRLAPEVYLDVVPVSIDSQGAYQLNQGRKIVEWLVKMKRLDDNNTLAKSIRNKKLTTLQTERLSKRLIDFYAAQAPSMLRSDEFLDRLRQRVLANRNDLLISLPAEAVTIQCIANAQLRCMTLEWDYFLQRVADGRIVDGHGDLRPEHVYFQRDQPLILDCIEFDAEYRTNDVIDEISFLSMECDRLGRHDVGLSMLSTYLAESTDTPKPFLTSFYRCHRACVRANTASLRAKQGRHETRASATELARSYLELAHSYAGEIGANIVILVCGLRGTETSTLAPALSRALSAELLHPNNNGNSHRDHLPADKITKELSTAFQSSPTVVLDGTFSSQVNRQHVINEASRLNALILQVQCELPRELGTRPTASGMDRSRDASLASSPPRASRDGDHVRPASYESATSELVKIDMTASGSEQVQMVVECVRKMESMT